jgi:hypothetical protein
LKCLLVLSNLHMLSCAFLMDMRCPFAAYDACQDNQDDLDEAERCPFGDNCPNLLSNGHCDLFHEDYEIDNAFSQRAENDARQAKVPSRPTGSARVSPPVCQYFLAGNCKFGDDCRNLHPAMGSACVRPEVCQYFLKGTCKFGDACKNRHPKICMDFLNGECPFGDECSDAHIH